MNIQELMRQLHTKSSSKIVMLVADGLPAEKFLTLLRDGMTGVASVLDSHGSVPSRAGDARPCRATITNSAARAPASRGDPDPTRRRLCWSAISS